VDTASRRFSARANGTDTPMAGDWAQVLLQVAEQILAQVLAQVSWQVSARWDLCPLRLRISRKAGPQGVAGPLWVTIHETNTTLDYLDKILELAKTN